MIVPLNRIFTISRIIVIVDIIYVRFSTKGYQQRSITIDH